LTEAAVDPALLAQLDEVEARLEIGQLAARYALALDARDLDTLVGLFVDDVDAGGDRGTGRDALRRYFASTASLAGFYRSAHLVAGHMIEFRGPDRARGVVHCRAEHEAGTRFGIMVMNYQDDYERHHGRWYFRRRRLQPLYACDLTERPSAGDFGRGWEDPEVPAARRGRRVRLPEEYPTFAPFFAGVDAGRVASLTDRPVASLDRRRPD
jgi:hypothetical protein